jgi:aminoglycoside 6-adenylyltransferase
MNPSNPVDDTILKLVQWANMHASIRAVMLTSTRAIPGAEIDILSDYDLILVVRDIHPFVTDHSWLNDFGEVLVAYWDAVHPDPLYGIEICSNVVQYLNGLKIDFSIWSVTLFEKFLAQPELPAELEAGYRILIDKDHLTEKMLPPTGKAYVPRPPTLMDYQTWVNDFLSDAPYVAKCLWRDELFPAKWCLDYDMKLIYLRQMLEWRLEIEQDWLVPVGSIGKGLKGHLPTDLWHEVERTFVGAQTMDNWEALFRTLELFRQVAIEVGDSLGFAYPQELHQRVREYVETIYTLGKKERL